jgi:hypothetical protein
MTTRRAQPRARRPILENAVASKMSGQKSLFRGKIRAPVSITLTKEHHAKVKKAMRRLGLTRADLLALLIHRYADVVKL